MYTVLIVDKRKQMVNIYKNMIHWKDYDFEIIAFVDNENDAISYYSEYQYDLVLMDLDLKEGNGLSLIREIKHINSASNIIVCTYQDDYETMRSAWKSGIRDYLLKGFIKNVQMRENLEAMREKFRYQNITSEHTWQQELQKFLGMIRDEQPITTGDFFQLLKRDELYRITNPNQMLFFRLDNVKQSFWEHKIVDREKLWGDLKHHIQVFFNDPTSYNLLFSKKHAGIILLDLMDLDQLYEVCVNLIRTIKHHMGISISIAISKPCKGYDDFYKEYIHLSNFLPQKFYTGDQTIVFMEHEQTFTRLQLNDIQFHERMLHYVSIQNFTKVFVVEKEMLDYMKEHQIDKQDVIAYCQSIMHAIEALEGQKGLHNKALFENIQIDFLKVESMKFLKKYFHSMLRMIVDWLKETSSEQYSKPVLLIIHYVEEHLEEKITLQMISSALHISPAHISRIFKQQTGKHLMQYINEQKMGLALRLLEHKNWKIKEVAIRVGIHDQLYFNKVFKSIYHMSPREYRNK